MSRCRRLLSWLMPPKKPIVNRKNLRARPWCEILEDRLAPATSIAPTHVYELNGTLTDELGGPALVADGGTLDMTRYTFGAGHGLHFTGALADNGNYSIVMTVEMDSLNPSFQKLLDFSSQTSDDGLYLSDGTLQLYPGDAGADSVTAGTDFQLAMTRNKDTGETKVYLNGVLQQTLVGEASDAAVFSDNNLTFFEDDVVSGYTEVGSGSVDRIAIYDGVLTSADVADLAGAAPPAVGVDQTTVTVKEGQTAANTGIWNGATTTLSVSVGALVQNANNTWSWSYATTDGPAQSQTVTVTANDGNGGTTVATFDLVVNNVAPTISAEMGPSINPDHVYNFDGNLNDAVGGPALEADGGTLSNGRYVFGPNQGLRLSGALTDTSTYSLVMTLEMDSTSPFFRKLVDFQERSQEAGLYASGDHLQLFPGAAGQDSTTAGTDFTFVLTRDGVTGETRLYVNGVFQMSYTGTASDEAVPDTNVLTFFEDDVTTIGTEAGSGSVDRIAIYNGVLTDADVAALANGVTTPATVDVTQGQSASLTGTWSDPGSDVVTLSTSQGQVTENGDGTWNWSVDTTNLSTGAYVVTVVATDSDGATGTLRFTLNVAPPNSPPSVQADFGTVAVTQGQNATNTGTWSDTEGDLVSLSASLGAVVENANGSWSWSLDTTNVATGHYSVSIGATDSHGGTSLVSFDLDVAAPNHPPSVASDQAAFGVTQGQNAANSGTWSDSDGDTVGLSASLGAVVENANGTWSWSLDTTNVATGHHTVSILATDSHGATSSTSFDLNVQSPNRPPTVTANLSGVTVNEGQTASNTGTWSDPDGDVVSLSASVGTVVKNANGTWSWSFATGNGPADSQSVTLTATDSHGAQSSASFGLGVNNMPPVFASLSSNHATLAQRSTDGNVTISGGYLDVPADTHTVKVNWGDGSAVQTLSNVDQLNDVFTAGHHYAQAGAFTITVTVTDSDGASVSQTTSAVVAGVSIVNGTVSVIGSPSQDNILIDVVKARKDTPAQLRVKIGNDVFYFTLSDVQKIVCGLDANDHLNLSKDVTVPVVYLT